MEESETRRKLVVLPYVKGLSEASARIFKKFETTVCYRLANTLGQQLFKLKDKADSSRWQMQYIKCSVRIVGEVTYGRPPDPNM